MHKIMVVEDDDIISKAIEERLKWFGFEVIRVEAFEKVVSIFEETSPQLVLLDIGLPHFSGFHWCSEIRKRSKVPVVFLSSAADNMNIVMAMNMGADDFIPKPFDFNVLTAKIQAILRRTYDYVGQTSVMATGGVVLHLNEAMLTFKSHKLALTKNDFKVLQLLMENPGTIVSRSAIMTRLWESDSFIDDNTLTVTMTRLRKKLEEMELEGFIITKKGLGYGIDPAVATEGGTL